jgi:uncharacterized membrane protein YfcA
MGLSGFGFAIMAISLMSFVWPVKEIIPFLFVYNIAINLFLLFQLRQYIDLRRVAPQVFGFAPGALVGLYGLYSMPDTTLKLIIGLVLMGFALWACFSTIQTTTSLHWGWHMIAGTIAGFLGGAVYMPGPPIIIINTLTHENRFAFKADLQVFFLISNLYLLLAYRMLELFTWPLLRLNLYFAPTILIGLFVGSRLCSSLPDKIFQKITYGLLLIMGVLLVARALNSVLH